MLGLNLLGDGLRDVLDPRMRSLRRRDGAPLLEVEGLTTALAGERRSRSSSNVSFALRPGEVLGVVGESGSGKSMLALSVMGLLPQAVRRTAGRIVLDGEDLAACRPRRWRAKRGRDLAMIFQEPHDGAEPGHAGRRAGRGGPDPPPRHAGRRGAAQEAIGLFQRGRDPLAPSSASRPIRTSSRAACASA